MEDHGVGHHDQCFEYPKVRLRVPQWRSRLCEDLDRAPDVADNHQRHEEIECREDYRHLTILGVLELVALLLAILE